MLRELIFSYDLSMVDKMKDLKQQIYKAYKDFDQKTLDQNFTYFQTLFEKYQENKQQRLLLKDEQNNSHIIPYSIATESQKAVFHIEDYENLETVNTKCLKDFGLLTCKMQAGLGTSVKRDDLLKKYTSRADLGSKGTDLFIDYEGKTRSIAEVQLLYAEKDKEQFHYIAFQNLINHETQHAVNEIWNYKHPRLDKTYNEVFNSEQLKRYPEIYQLMMPTIDEENEISFDRVAPAGHGFLGFVELLNIFKEQESVKEVMTIGNGEDLQSNPDTKILSWVIENEIPLTMITTTKLEKDKKGGQLALVEQETPYVTIVEKAQAQKAGQLSYFEQLGLRAGDDKALFNTNIVVINKKALKDAFQKYLRVSESEFMRIIAPDLIKNEKEQNGKKFIQLEGAIGSVILNLDKFFRTNYKKPLVSFLNLAPHNREKFFLPIKKREDFDEIYRLGEKNIL